MNSKLKALEEKRTELLTQMEQTLEIAKQEERAMNEEEIKKFENDKKEVVNINKTIKAEEEIRAMNIDNESARAEEIRTGFTTLANSNTARATFNDLTSNNSRTAFTNTSRSAFNDLNSNTRAAFNDLTSKRASFANTTLNASRAAFSNAEALMNPQIAFNPEAEKRELRAFDKFVRSKFSGKSNTNLEEEVRANMTITDNGAVIPTTIANRIIETVRDICPIYSLAEVYNLTGNLQIPSYGANGAEDVNCDYAAEFTDPTSTVGKFSSVTLTGFLARSFVKISRDLINNSQFNIVSFIVRKMSDAINVFLEKELLTGTGTNACQGILTGVIENVIQTSAALKSDDLIDLQESIIDRYQMNSVWIMNRKTRAAIRKLKDGQGNYLLNREFTSRWGYELLGKPVYTSDVMPALENNAKAIIYGDMTGLTVKIDESINIQVLNELYAPQHATGVVGFVNVDSKVTDQQKLAVLEITTA